MKKAAYIILIFLLVICIIWLILWLAGKKKYPVAFGISFNQNHATDLGLDWQEVYTVMLEELKPPYVRIAAMWSDVEPKKDTFDFSSVDFMMDEAAQAGAKVTLVVGQKAPRWPECHVPDWLNYDKEAQARVHLLEYVKAVVERYRAHPALELWQVENEPFIPFAFGECAHYQSAAVYEEIELVRELDPEHKIMITDSGELSTWRLASNAGDIFGTTLYRVVRTPRGQVVKYDWLPAGFYFLKSRLWGRGYDDFFVSELQTEPWFTSSDPTDTPIAVQEKTMNPKRLRRHLDYVRHTGASRAYLWGVEWWYFMKEKKGDGRYWETVRCEYTNTC